MQCGKGIKYTIYFLSEYTVRRKVSNEQKTAIQYPEMEYKEGRGLSIEETHIRQRDIKERIVRNIKKISLTGVRRQEEYDAGEEIGDQRNTWATVQQRGSKSVVPPVTRAKIILSSGIRILF